MSPANKKETALSPLEEKLVKELVTEGREKGFVTLDEINENLGDETPSAEQLEKIFDIFAEMDIEVIDSEKKTDIAQDNIDSGPGLDFDAQGWILILELTIPQMILYACIYVRWAVSSC